MTWRCLNAASAKQHRDHRYFVEAGTRRYAVADWSMRIADRPDTADDGLLILDPGRDVIVQPTGILVPVKIYHTGANSHVTSSIKQLEVLLGILQAAGMTVKVRDDLARVVRLLEPYVTTDGEGTHAENTANG